MFCCPTFATGSVFAFFAAVLSAFVCVDWGVAWAQTYREGLRRSKMSAASHGTARPVEDDDSCHGHSHSHGR
jgi:hypothetical protein